MSYNILHDFNFYHLAQWLPYITSCSTHTCNLKFVYYTKMHIKDG